MLVPWRFYCKFSVKMLIVIALADLLVSMLALLVELYANLERNVDEPATRLVYGNRVPLLLSGYEVHESGQWIFNMNVSQYSCQASVESSTRNILLESLVFFDHDEMEADLLPPLDTDDHINNTNNTDENASYQRLLDERRLENVNHRNVKCLVLLNDLYSSLRLVNASLVRIQLEQQQQQQTDNSTTTTTSNKSLWKVECRLEPLGGRRLRRPQALAVLDMRYYEHHRRVFAAAAVDGLSPFPSSLLTLQQPRWLDRQPRAKRTIAHCLHMLNMRDQNAERVHKLLNWIELQRSVGYQKLKIYLYNVTRAHEHRLRLTFGEATDDEPFVEFARMPRTLHQVCGCEPDFQPYNALREFLYANCRRAFMRHIHVEASIEDLADSAVYGALERLCTNDCYMSMRHSYELVSNYDYDEFIFPRLHTTMPSSSSSSLDVLASSEAMDGDEARKTVAAYNVHAYVMRLLAKYGGETRRHMCSLTFAQVLLLNNHTEFAERVLATSTGLDRFVRYEQDAAHITFEKNTGDDKRRLARFKRLVPIVHALNRTHMHNATRFHYKWNNALGTHSQLVFGKSVFVTDLVESIYQHAALSVEPASASFQVPLDDGFLSHFRDLLSKRRDLLGHTQPFSFLHVDLEYYQFLVALSQTSQPDFYTTTSSKL